MKRPAVLVVTAQNRPKEQVHRLCGRVSSRAPRPLENTSRHGACRGRVSRVPSRLRGRHERPAASGRRGHRAKTFPGHARKLHAPGKNAPLKDEIEIALIRHALRQKNSYSRHLPRLATAQRRLRRNPLRRRAKRKEIAPEAHRFFTLRQLPASDFHRRREARCRSGIEEKRCA